MPMQSQQQQQERQQQQHFNIADDEEEIDEIIETDPDEAQHHPIVDGDAVMLQKVSEASDPKDLDDNKFTDNIESAAYDSRFFQKQKDGIVNSGKDFEFKKRASSAKKLSETHVQNSSDQDNVRFQAGEAYSFATAGSLNMIRRPTSSAKKRPSDTVVKRRMGSGSSSQNDPTTGRAASKHHIRQGSMDMQNEIEASGTLAEEIKVFDNMDGKVRQAPIPAQINRPWQDNNLHEDYDNQMQFKLHQPAAVSQYETQQDFLMLEHFNGMNQGPQPTQHLSQSEVSPPGYLLPNGPKFFNSSAPANALSSASLLPTNQPMYQQPVQRVMYQSMPPKKKWSSASDLLMIEASAPIEQAPISIVDAFCDQQTKFGLLPHFLPAFAKRADDDKANSEHSLTDAQPDEIGIAKETEIQEEIMGFVDQKADLNARKNKDTVKMTKAKKETIQLKKQRRMMRKSKYEAFDMNSLNYENQILVQQMPEVVQVLNLDQTQGSQLSGNQQTVTTSPRQQMQERRELRALQEQQFRLSMSSMKNQISEVIKEDLNESNDNTGRNTPHMRSEKGGATPEDHHQGQPPSDRYHSSGKKVISGEVAIDKQKQHHRVSQLAVDRSVDMSNYEDQKFEEVQTVEIEDQQEKARSAQKTKLNEEQVDEEYQSSPRESKIEKKISGESLQHHKERDVDEQADPDVKINSDDLDVKGSMEDMQGPTCTPIESKEESVAQPDQQVEVKPPQQPNEALESLKCQIEGIAEMLQGLNSMCDQQSMTPKSTKRSKRKVSPAVAAQKQEQQQNQQQIEEVSNTVMPQRKIKSIKIKKVQVQRMRGQKVRVTTTLGSKDGQREQRTLRKSQSATMRINRRHQKKSSSEDSARFTGVPMERRPWVAGIAPPAKHFERHRRNHAQQNRFRSSRFSSQSITDFAHLADRQWRSLSNSPVRHTTDYPTQTIQPYDARMQVEQARARQAYNYQAKRLMLRSAQQTAPTTSEFHSQGMQPPVPSTMASMKRMRFKKMHTTINPKSSSHPSLAAAIFHDQPSSSASIIHAGRRQSTQSRGDLMRTAQANNSSMYSFAPPGANSSYMAQAAGMHVPVGNEARPSRILSAQTKLSQGGTPSVVHSLTRHDRNYLQQAASRQASPDEQVLPQQFYQPNVDVIYEQRNSRSQRKKQVQSAKVATRQMPQQLQQQQMMQEMPQHQRPVHYTVAPGQQVMQQTNRLQNLPQSLQASPYSQVLKLPPYQGGGRRHTVGQLQPDFHPSVSTGDLLQHQQQAGLVRPQSGYGASMPMYNQQPLMVRPAHYQSLNASMQALTSKPLIMNQQQQHHQVQAQGANAVAGHQRTSQQQHQGYGTNQRGMPMSNTMRRPPAVPLQRGSAGYPPSLEQNQQSQAADGKAQSRGSEIKSRMATTGQTMAAPLQSQRIRSAAPGTEASKMTSGSSLTRVRSGTTRAPQTFMNQGQLATVESLRAPNSQRKALSRRNSAASGRGKNSGSSSLGNGKQSSSRKKRQSNASARASNNNQLMAPNSVASNGDKKKNGKQVVIQQIYNFS